jgi:DNA-binding beta-propeller fold protein YncE
VATAGDGRAWRIDSDANRTSGSVRVGGQPRDIATDGKHLFVTDRQGDRVVEIDPQSMRIVHRDPVTQGPLSVAVDDEDVWVTRIDAGEVSRVPRR